MERQGATTLDELKERRVSDNTKKSELKAQGALRHYGLPELRCHRVSAPRVIRLERTPKGRRRLAQMVGQNFRLRKDVLLNDDDGRPRL